MMSSFAKTLNAYYAGYAYEAAQHLRPTVRSTPPETRFVLFARGRSGTTLLLSMLNAHPAVEADGEILRRRALCPLQLVKQCEAQTQASVYGFKLLSYQLRSLQTHLPDRRAFLEALVEQGYRVLYLRRQNLLRHALSGLYAEHRRRWHQTETDAADRPAIRVRRDDLFRWLDGSAQLRRFEQEGPAAPVTHLRRAPGRSGMPRRYAPPRDRMAQPRSHRPRYFAVQDYPATAVGTGHQSG